MNMNLQKTLLFHIKSFGKDGISNEGLLKIINLSRPVSQSNLDVALIRMMDNLQVIRIDSTGRIFAIKL